MPRQTDRSWEQRFLDLRRSGVPAEVAAAAVGISLATVKSRRKKYPTFKKAEQEAKGIAVGNLETRLYRRAMDGSDRATEFYLKSHKREVYGDMQKKEVEIDDKRIASNAEIAAQLNTDSELARIADEFAARLAILTSGDGADLGDTEMGKSVASGANFQSGT